MRVVVGPVGPTVAEDARLRELLARRLSEGASDFEEALRRVKDAACPSLESRSLALCSGGRDDADHPFGSFPGIRHQQRGHLSESPDAVR